MIDGFTMLPKCRWCGGAFYPHPDCSRWDHVYYDDCWLIAAKNYAMLGFFEDLPKPPTPRSLT